MKDRIMKAKDIVVNGLVKASTFACAAALAGTMWFGVKGRFPLAGTCLKAVAACVMVNLVVRAFGGAGITASPEREDVPKWVGDIGNDEHTNFAGRFDLGVVRPNEEGDPF